MSVFLSKSEIDDKIASNILNLINYRNIKNVDINKTNILSIIKNHEIKVFNNFLIGFIYDKDLNNFINKLGNYKYDKGILILDTNEEYKFSKDTLYKKNINIFTKNEFYRNLTQTDYYVKHEIIDIEDFKKSYPNILINQLPLILHYDPPIRYIGGNVGEIVKIYRKNPSGENIYYRLIK